jgi:hypothetical protein
MMNSNQILPTQTTSTELPQLPNPNLPSIPTDPGNPLAWILVMTLLLGNIDEIINALANLIRARTSSKRNNRKRSNRRG